MFSKINLLELYYRSTLYGVDEDMFLPGEQSYCEKSWKTNPLIAIGVTW